MLDDQEQKELLMDEMYSKIWERPEFSKVYVQNFYTWYKIDLDYSGYISQLERARCLTLDDVSIIYDCLGTNGGTFLEFFGLRVFKFFFEKNRWIVSKGLNPFVDIK